MESSIKKQLIYFLAITFAITYFLGGVAYYKGGLDKFPATLLQMFVPGLVALGIILFSKQKPYLKELGLKFSGGKYLLSGSALMILVVGVSFLLCAILYNGYFLSIEKMQATLSKASIPLPSDNLLLQLSVIFSLNVILGPFLNIIIFLGEEIGWRAFMMPRLLKLYGNKAYLIGGTIWAIWHAVIIALGHNYPGFPILGNILFVFLCIPLGYLLQYFYIKSESVFIPAIMHGVVNKLTMTVLVFTVDDSKVQPMINTPAGIIGVVVFSCAAIIIYKRTLRASITDVPH
jgi:uncharacterized protein